MRPLADVENVDGNPRAVRSCPPLKGLSAALENVTAGKVQGRFPSHSDAASHAA